jgi:glycine dehydrogenase
MSADKYVPPVGRIDGAWGDRHLVATLAPPSSAGRPAGEAD